MHISVLNVRITTGEKQCKVEITNCANSLDSFRCRKRLRRGGFDLLERFSQIIVDDSQPGQNKRIFLHVSPHFLGGVSLRIHIIDLNIPTLPGY